MKELISEEIIKAMKAKDKIRLNTLRYVKKLFIENDTSKKPIEEIEIVISYAKKLNDSMGLYPEGSEQREDLQAECDVLKEFLPSPLNEEEVEEIVANIISSLDNPNMGSVMKELSPQVKGRFDGKLASQMVINALKKS